MRGLTSQQTASAYIAEIEIGKLGGMKTYSSAAALRTAIHSARRAGKTVAFVPTMGNLHEGHISLVRRASREADIVVVNHHLFFADNFARDVDVSLWSGLPPL